MVEAPKHYHELDADTHLGGSAGKVLPCYAICPLPFECRIRRRLSVLAPYIFLLWASSHSSNIHTFHMRFSFSNPFSASQLKKWKWGSRPFVVWIIHDFVQFYRLTLSSPLLRPSSCRLSVCMALLRTTDKEAGYLFMKGSYLMYRLMDISPSLGQS